jgi:hypothetical protein
MAYLINELNVKYETIIRRVPLAGYHTFTPPTIETFEIYHLHTFVSKGLCTPDTIDVTRNKNENI